MYFDREQCDFEAVLITTKNKEIWVRAIGNAEFINGKCKRIYGSFQDINERKEAEVRLQSLADNLPA
jgi:PAS domain-containing protein